MFYVGGGPQPTSAVVFCKKVTFFWLKQKSKMFKLSYFSRIRSRTPAKSEDGTICNNSLQLKAVFYGIVTRSSFLNVRRGPTPVFDCNGISYKSELT